MAIFVPRIPPPVTGSMYCGRCGSALLRRYVEEEERERLVCPACNHIHYINPHVVTGTIPETDAGIWLLRRAIEPRYGYWTFPAGFMEMAESAEEAAVRETREELGIEVRIRGLLGVFSRATWSNVMLVYEAHALSEPTGGRETLEFREFSVDTIPWVDLAFPSTREALRAWVDRHGGA